MQRRHRSVRIALRDINKKGVEIGERQNRCHDDMYNLFQSISLQTCSKHHNYQATMCVLCLQLLHLFSAVGRI